MAAYIDLVNEQQRLIKAINKFNSDNEYALYSDMMGPDYSYGEELRQKLVRVLKMIIRCKKEPIAHVLASEPDFRKYWTFYYKETAQWREYQPIVREFAKGQKLKKVRYSKYHGEGTKEMSYAIKSCIVQIFDRPSMLLFKLTYPDLIDNSSFQERIIPMYKDVTDEALNVMLEYTRKVS